jgi:hypothetical protein
VFLTRITSDNSLEKSVRKPISCAVEATYIWLLIPPERIPVIKKRG